MKIYLDTANVLEIEKASSLKLIDGVTTNPTLIAREGRDFKEELKEILKILKKNIGDDFTLSAEVNDLSSVDSIISQARDLSKLDKHILVKIPLTTEGLAAVKILSGSGIRCNVTLCFSANQAILAAKAGAWCVSPFLGRVDDEGYDGVELISEIKKIYVAYGFKTKILGASIRSTHHVMECAMLGVDIVTIPYKVFLKMYYNPLTDIGVDSFNKDWEELNRNLRRK